MPNTKSPPNRHPRKERVKLCDFLGMFVLCCTFITHLLTSDHPPHHAPPGATPWPSEMLPPATTATMGLRRRAGDDSTYHDREAPAFAEPCL